VVEKCSPERIEGSATLTIAMSRMTMNWARQTTSRSAFVERGNLVSEAVVAFTWDTVQHFLSRYKRGVYPGSRTHTQHF
jgi:hypothetical protein